MSFKIYSTLFIILFGIKLNAQDIMFEALYKSNESCGQELLLQDSLAGYHAGVFQYYSGAWHVVEDLRRLGEKIPAYYLNDSSHFRKFHETDREYYPSKHYSLSYLTNLCDSQKVLFMGYYSTYNAPPEKDREDNDEEFIAIRLTEKITEALELNLHFKLIVEYGAFLDLFTNDLPQTENAFFVDELLITTSQSKKLIEFNQSYKNHKKQYGHDWLIIRINHKKSIRKKFGPAIALMAPDACTCEQKEPLIKIDLYDKNKSYNVQFNFSSGSVEIIRYDTLQVYRMVNYLHEYSLKKVGFVGHTDSIGNPDDNIKLSTDRAKTVYELFHAMGIAYVRMQYKGVGDAQPIASNETEEGRLLNRRVEIWIW